VRRRDVDAEAVLRLARRVGLPGRAGRFAIEFSRLRRPECQAVLKSDSRMNAATSGCTK
jgi:hypothetical protein